jgi:hypothetical protein
LTGPPTEPYSASEVGRSIGWIPEAYEPSGVPRLNSPSQGRLIGVDGDDRMSKNESVTHETGSPTGTPSSPAAGSRIEVAGDEDWKSRVKAEAAALDQQFRSQPPGNPTAAPKPAGQANAETPSAATSEATAASDTPDSASRAFPDREPAREMPEPTFADLVALLSTQAMMFLGLIPNPATQKTVTQLPTARYFIDLISILEEKTAGRITKEESTILAETLHSLRMTFMQRSKQTG